MNEQLQEKLTPDFQMNVVQNGAAWTVRFKGTLDINDASGRIQPQLMKLHDSIVSQKVPNVRVEVNDVDYMNSSGLKGFMAWFLKAEMTKENHYSIEVIYDAGRSWQSVSLTPMERLAPRTLKMKAVQEGQ